MATIQEMAGKQASAIQQILQLVHVSHLSPTRHTRLGSQSVTYHNDLFGAKTYTQLGKCEEEEEGRKNSWDRFRSTAHLATAWLDYCHPMMGPEGQHHVLFTLSPGFLSPLRSRSPSPGVPDGTGERNGMHSFGGNALGEVRGTAPT